MVSLQASIESPTTGKKRKWGDGGDEAVSLGFAKGSKLWRADRTDAKSDIELHLDTPLPLEWQRCLDIKSGQIHYYNTRTRKRTSKDPRTSPEPGSSIRPTLDLELNLTCHADQKERAKEETNGDRCNDKDHIIGMSRSPSWVSIDGDDKEMVAAVCIRCHMLVMMCKASLSCPNCKFVHQKDQSPPLPVRAEFRLLCCRD